MKDNKKFDRTSRPDEFHISIYRSSKNYTSVRFFLGINSTDCYQVEIILPINGIGEDKLMHLVNDMYRKYLNYCTIEQIFVLAKDFIDKFDKTELKIK